MIDSNYTATSNIWYNRNKGWWSPPPLSTSL